jgi:hypothetical protein
MSTTLTEKITSASEKGDLSRLHQLHLALTKNRSISHYAGLAAGEAQRAAEVAEAAIERLTPRPRKKREKPPVELDFSGLEQADLFLDLGRWPRKPYCTDDFDAGVKIRSLKQALTHTYISANPPHLRVWSMFDIDRSDAANAWEQAALPPPAWTAVNKLNGHAHSVWGLSAPVLVDGIGARDAPMRFLVSIESMMREKLKADTGYAKLLTKNPAHPLWETLRGPRQSYSLQELAEYLPGIEKYRPNKSAEKIGLGRNVTLFDTMRKWAYKAIRKYWGGGLSGWNAWMSACNNQALVMNADLFGMNTLDGREVWHLAKSVAKWTWRNLSIQGFSEWQSKAGTKGAIKSAKVRASASENKRASARLMSAQGMSIRQIAEELDVGKSTVDRWLK